MICMSEITKHYNNNDFVVLKNTFSTFTTFTFFSNTPLEEKLSSWLLLGRLVSKSLKIGKGGKGGFQNNRIIIFVRLHDF